jgi:transposase
MLNWPVPGGIYLCTRPADLRRSFDGLAQLVREFLGADPLSGQLFVFRNQRGDRLKLLYWDGDGYAIWYKRLEEGRFAIPAADASRPTVGAHGVSLRPAELAMLLDGLDLSHLKRSRRYQRPTSRPAEGPLTDAAASGAVA